MDVENKKVAQYPGTYYKIRPDPYLSQYGISYFNWGLLTGVMLPVLTNKTRNDPAFRCIYFLFYFSVILFCVYLR